SSPIGMAAAVLAVVATQSMHDLVGMWTQRPTGGPNTPARTPAGRPHVVTMPAAGTAARLAGMATTGIPPKRGISTGATASWAANVTARASRSHRGPTRTAANGLLSRTIPSDAATESWNPTEW